MNTLTRRALVQSLLQAAAAAAGASALPSARAAEGKVVFGYFPGPVGVPGMSALLKALQGRYQPDLGLKVNYLTGNSGLLSLDAVRRAAPDGGTVLLAPSSLMTLLPLLRTLPGVDPATDFVPVAALHALSGALVLGPTVPADITQLKDYLAWVRSNPTQASYGVPGLGTVPHLLGTLLGESAGVGLMPAAYKNFTSLVDDLTYGSLPSAIVPQFAAVGLAAAGRARLLAVSSDSRWPTHPAVATFRELGVIDFDPGESLGLHLSSRTAPEKVRELAAAVRQAMQSPAVAAGYAADGLPPPQPDAPDYADVIARERQTWAAVIKKHRFSIDS